MPELRTPATATGDRSSTPERNGCSPALADQSRARPRAAGGRRQHRGGHRTWTRPAPPSATPPPTTSRSSSRRITLTKLVNGDSHRWSIQAPATEVTYTYAATNTGNTPLGSVTLVDDTPPCEAPVRGPDPNGNEILDVGETWNYTCTALVTENVLNTATVTGTPLNPRQGNARSPTRTHRSRILDTASVTVVDPDLTLTKVVDRTLVFAGTAVTYTYTATNQGDTDLRNDTGRRLGHGQFLRAGRSGGRSRWPQRRRRQRRRSARSIPARPGSSAALPRSHRPSEHRHDRSPSPSDNGDPSGTTLTRRAFAFVQVVTPEHRAHQDRARPGRAGSRRPAGRGPGRPRPPPGASTCTRSSTPATCRSPTSSAGRRHLRRRHIRGGRRRRRRARSTPVRCGSTPAKPRWSAAGATPTPRRSTGNDVRRGHEHRDGAGNAVPARRPTCDRPEVSAADTAPGARSSSRASR